MVDGPLLLSWEQFSEPAIFRSVQNIKSFELLLQFPQFASSGDDGLTKRLVDRLYQEVFAVTSEAGLASQDQIERFSRGSGASGHQGVRYTSEPWEFSLDVSPDQSLRLTRSGSSFRRFYEWYAVIMPRFSRFADALTEEYEQVVHGRSRSEVHIRPARVMFSFEFLMHDFLVPNDARRVKNSRLLQSMLTQVPGADGGLIRLDESALTELGRVDLKVSRWSSYPVGRVREVYEIQAPGNRDYGALWVTFTYIGETSDGEALPRAVPDMDDIIRRIDIPLNDFLQKRALSSFLSTLSSGVSFSTTSGSLP